MNVATQPIGPGGGMLASTDGKLTVTVPSGAVPSTSTFTVQRLSAAPASAVGPAYEIGPSGTTFAQPITLTFQFASADLAGHPPKSLRIATFSDGTWNPVASSIDEAAHLVTGQTSHLSTWSLVFAASAVVDGGIDGDAGPDGDAGRDAGGVVAGCTGTGQWLGDFDGDGTADCAVGDGPSVNFFQGLGGGLFAGDPVTTAGILPTLPAAYFASIVDLTGDGRQDLLLTTSSSATTTLLRGQAGGTFVHEFQDTATLDTFVQVPPVIGDFTGDGKPDLFVPSIRFTPGNNNISWNLLQFRDNAPSWRTTDAGFICGTLGGVIGAIGGDIDNDGDQDGIAIIKILTAGFAGPGNVVVVATSNGDGTFVVSTHADAAPLDPSNMVAGTEGATAVTTGDVNTDGNLDLLVTLPGGPQTFFGDGRGHFGPAMPEVDAGSDGEVSGDSGTGGMGSVDSGSGGAGGAPPTDCTGAQQWGGDFNGDGKADCAVGNGRDVYFYQGVGGGQFSNSPVVSLSVLMPLPTTYFVSIFDLTNDGRQDLVFTTSISGDTFLLRGQANGTFVRGIDDFTSLQLGVEVQPVIADVTGDGHPDLFVPGIRPTAGNNDVFWGLLRFDFANDVPVWTTSRAGFFYGTTGHMILATTGDVDNDGDQDGIVLVRIKTAAQAGPGNVVVVAMSSGDGTFQPGTQDLLIPSGMVAGTEGATAVSTSHVDGDGNLDLLVMLPGGQTAFFGDGHGHFSTTLTTADAGTDGDAMDAVVDQRPDGGDAASDSGSGGAGGGGSGGAGGAPPTDCTAALQWQGDFNGDGTGDCAVGSGTAVYLYAGIGSGQFSASPVVSKGVLPTLTSTYFVSIVDLTGDGRQDLVVTFAIGTSAYLLRGQADGSFVRGLNDSTSLSLFMELQPLIGEFTGDGRSDLFIPAFLPSGSNTVYWTVLDLEANDLLYWRSTNSGLNYGSQGRIIKAASGDIDNDGDRDGIAIIRIQNAAFTGPGNVVVVAISNGDGTFQAATQNGMIPSTMVAGSQGATDVVPSDGNGDGKLDLLVTLPAGQKTFYGDGHGHFGVTPP